LASALTMLANSGHCQWLTRRRYSTFPCHARYGLTSPSPSSEASRLRFVTFILLKKNLLLRRVFLPPPTSSAF